jgi:hypothetical protein
VNTRVMRGHLAVVVSHVSVAVPFVLGALLAVFACSSACRRASRR